MKGLLAALRHVSGTTLPSIRSQCWTGSQRVAAEAAGGTLVESERMCAEIDQSSVIVTLFMTTSDSGLSPRSVEVVAIESRASMPDVTWPKMV